MKKILIGLLVLTSCKTQQTYIFKPGDIVKVQNTRFLIMDYNKGRKGLFYKAKDLKNGYNVEYFSQERLKSVKYFPQEKILVKNKSQHL